MKTRNKDFLFYILSRVVPWYDDQEKPFDLMTTVHLNTDQGREPKPKEQIQRIFLNPFLTTTWADDE